MTLKNEPGKDTSTRVTDFQSNLSFCHLETNKIAKQQLRSLHFENALISVDNTVLQNVKVLYKFLIQKE